MSRLDEIGEQMTVRYERQGYEVIEASCTKTARGWIYQADIWRDGAKTLVTAMGNPLGLVSEIISSADEDPFTSAVTRLMGDR